MKFAWFEVRMEYPESGYCRLLAGALLALLCIASRAEPSVDIRAKDDIQVANAWIRWLPANLPGAGYATLTNTGSTLRVLAGVSSPDYGDVSIHVTHDNNGMTEMRPIDSITLKPHTSVRLAEGGIHFMLMQPKRVLHPGDRVLVTLRFTEGPAITIPFDVRAGNY
jgi:copper(I)-binding protein